MVTTPNTMAGTPSRINNQRQPAKGGSPDAWETIHNSPGLQDLWQLHYALDSDKAHNVSEMFIANLNENCEGNYIKVAAERNGTFTVLNSRNKYQKTYSK
jgi:competence protein ComEC